MEAAIRRLKIAKLLAGDADATFGYNDPAFEDPDKTYCKRGGYLGSLGVVVEHGELLQDRLRS